MERVYLSTEGPITSINFVGIFLTETNPHIHTGLIYLDEEDEVNYLHLAFHNRLSCSAPNNDFLWVDSEIPEDRAFLIARYCKLVKRKNDANEIPYAFSEPSDSFFQDGKFQEGHNRYGLTCATFVLSVFDAAGWPLLKYETWETRQEDIEWQEDFLELLECHVGEEHLDRLEDEIGNHRFRPTETGAGVAVGTEAPISFDRAIEVGDRLAEVIQASL